MENKVSETFTGNRITVTSLSSYDVVLERINQETQIRGSVTTGELASVASKDRADLTGYFEQKTGPLGFTQFHEIDHSEWIKAFDVGNGLRLRRILLGNPLIAITMLELDLYSGLFLPVELLLRELDRDRGTEVIYVLPSSLISGVSEDEKLKAASQELDKKFEALIAHIASS